MADRVPFPYETAVLVVSVVVDLGLVEALQELVMGSVDVYIVYSVLLAYFSLYRE